MTTTTRISPALVAAPLVLLAMWGIPRIITATLGVDGHWTPFLYQYLLGGMVFSIGLWIIRRSGACDPARPGEGAWFYVLIFGYFWYAGIHAILTWLAVAVAFRGGGA